MESDSKIINSLYLQDELNPDIWYLPNEKHMGDPEAQFYKLKSEIKNPLKDTIPLEVNTITV